MPTAEHAALTRREVIRALTPFAKSSTTKGLALFLYDYGSYWLAIAGVLFLPGWPLKILAGVFAGTKLPVLIVLGHDAAHGTLTRSKRLNWLLGVLSFTTCFYNYRMWIYDHHVQHHARTNHEQKDTYTPYTKQEFDGLPKWRQILERFYRRPSFVSFAVYYIVERWAPAKVFPQKGMPEEYSRPAWKHAAFLAAYITIFTAAMALSPTYASATTLQSIVCGIFVPFYVFMGLNSWILWAMHTSPEVGWFRPGRSPSYLGDAGELVSVQIVTPSWFSWLIHNINEHPVHHLFPAIPCYRLKEAGAKFAEIAPDLNVRLDFTFSKLFDTARRCKLYDFDSNRWLNFEGTPTSELTRPFRSAKRVHQYLELSRQTAES